MEKYIIPCKTLDLLLHIDPVDSTHPICDRCGSDSLRITNEIIAGDNEQLMGKLLRCNNCNDLQVVWEEWVVLPKENEGLDCADWLFISE